VIVHAEKCGTEDKLKIQPIHKLNPEKANNAKYSRVAFYDIWPGNEMGLFYNALGPTQVSRDKE